MLIRTLSFMGSRHSQCVKQKFLKNIKPSELVQTPENENSSCNTHKGNQIVWTTLDTLRNKHGIAYKSPRPFPIFEFKCREVGHVLYINIAS